MKKQLRAPILTILSAAFLSAPFAQSVYAVSNTFTLEHKTSPASYIISAQYETEPAGDAATVEETPEILEEEILELEEELSPEELMDLEQEGEVEYILIDEEGNIIDEEILYEETGEEFQEGVGEEDVIYLEEEEAAGEEDVIYLEEENAIEDAEPVTEEYDSEETDAGQEERYQHIPEER